MYLCVNPSLEVQPLYVKGIPQAAFRHRNDTSSWVCSHKDRSWVKPAGGRRVVQAGPSGARSFWHTAWKVDCRVQLSMSFWSRIVSTSFLQRRVRRPSKLLSVDFSVMSDVFSLCTDMLLVSTWNMTSVTAELNLKFYLLLINSFKFK